MKKNYLIILLAFLAFSIKAQVNFVWAKSLTSTNTGSGYSTVADAAGNVYTTGRFSGTTDFDPGPGVFNLNPVGGFDIFICKLNSSGNFVWAKNIGSTTDDEGHGLCVDPSGNVYTTGIFSGTVDFDPGPGTYTLTTSTWGMFISKLDVNGNFIWALSAGGSDYAGANAIAIDPSGNILTTGSFTGTVDFDVSPAVFNLTSYGGSDVFIHKVNSAGSFLWAKNLGGSNTDIGRSVCVDGSGSVYTTGTFDGTVDLDPGPGTYTATSAGSNDIFISKLDASGNFVLGKTMGGTSSDISYGIVLDGLGNIYSTGRFNISADFDPGPVVYNLFSAGGDDIFISKLDASGNFIWAKRMGGSQWDYGNGIAIDVTGNIYTTGQFYLTSDFDPGPGVYNLTANGSQPDAFISKLDASGNFLWAGKLSGAASESGNSIFVDSQRTIYSTGTYYGTVDFDPGPAVFNLINAAFSPYSHKMCQVPDQPTSISGNTLVCGNSSNIYSVNAVPGATSYSWSLPFGWAGSSSTATINVTAGNTSNLISVTAINACGASASFFTTINVNPSPTITVSSGGICVGDSFTMTVGGANTYTFSGGGPVVSPTITSSYSVTGTSTAGCISASPAISNVWVSPLPVITANSGSICLGNSFTIIPSGANSYTYSGGSAIVSPTSNTSYSVVGTSTDGCISSSPAISNITVNALPLPTITVNSGSICIGNSFTMVPGGANTYSFSGGSAVVSPTTNTSYSVTGTNNAGCVSTTAAISNITVGALPNIITTSSNSLICTGETATLTASGAATYTWNGGPNTSTNIVTPTLTTNYSVTATGTNGCQKTVVFTQSVSLCTVTEDLKNENSEITIFPNPNNGNIIINSGKLSENTSIEIYNSIGQLVHNQKIVDVETSINFYDNAAGIYLIKILQKSKAITQWKVIKQ